MFFLSVTNFVFRLMLPKNIFLLLFQEKQGFGDKAAKSVVE
jgi:hypothetical protein